MQCRQTDRMSDVEKLASVLKALSDKPPDVLKLVAGALENSAPTPSKAGEESCGKWW